MRINGIDFPQPILDALRDDKLVVFAGAGVSMGDPANLPSFKDLAIAISHGTGETLQERETEDQFLGRLAHKDTRVHERASEELSRDNPQPTELHRDLLRLYTTRGSPRIVTTNFDQLFETAAKGVFKSDPEIFNAPALPLGRECDGIVHVHGTLDRPNGMVLTDKDFGRAYLTDGWALSFLVELFQTFTVLFVGYSHSDMIMNYLARALPVEQAESRFALTCEDDDSRWGFLGIKPIRYTQLPCDNHYALYAGVSGLADYASRSILDWQREITEIATKPPPLHEEEIDFIEEALRDAMKTRFFTAAAVSIEWVDWLEKRDHLAGLFGTGDLNERDVLLVEWIAKRFARRHPDELFLLIGRPYMRPHPKFWEELCRSVSSKENSPCDSDTLSRWVSLLLTTAPAQLDDEYLLFRLGKHCVKNELVDCVVDVFDAMAASRVMVRRRFPWPDSDEEESGPRIVIELAFVSDHFTINELWLEGLKPNLNRISEPLLTAVVGQLTTQHRKLSAWQEANRDWNPLSRNRNAIEPHEQDEYHETVDVLIDAARDCLEWLASSRPKVAAQWRDQLVRGSSPILRRLGVHILSQSQDLNTNEKIEWLLRETDLHDSSAHHELFQFMKSIYPRADEQQRMAVIEAIQAYCPRQGEDETSEENDAAYYQFTWYHWLHVAAPDCPVAEAALRNVSRRNPDFQPREHPDLILWTSSFPGGHQSPWTVDELLSKPAEEWAEELLSFQDSGIHEPDRLGLNFAVSEAAKRRFEWGVDLADALAARDAWDTDLWDTLLRVWSDINLDQKNAIEILKRIHRTELYTKYARPISEFLYKLVVDGDRSDTHLLYPKANRIAADLWPHVERNEICRAFDSWLTTAINHAAGFLAGYWLSSLYCWRKQHDYKPKSLSEEYRNALSDIVKDETVAGRLGRSVLARDLAFLLDVDRNWTETNLIPSFARCAKNEDRQAVWDGLLYGSLSPDVADLIRDAFLSAVSQIMTDLSHEGKRQFIRRYITMLAYFSDDPHKVWIPRFFEHADEYARRSFSIAIGNSLKHMNDAQQLEWWNRWLKNYWRNRLQGVPDRLYDSEIGIMFCWLPDLQGVFPEAVNLAVQMQLEEFTGHSADSNRVVYMIEKGDLWNLHPEAVAQLLIHLGRIKSRPRAWRKGKELIDKLLKANLSCEKKRQLEELAVERGMT